MRSHFAMAVAGLLSLAAAPVGNATDAAVVRALPLVEVPAAPSDMATMTVLVSGDGGWSALDKAVGAAFSARGVPVVGLNSLRYFLRRRTPEESAEHLAAVLRVYSETWNKQRFVLVGYSLGADVLPFMVNRLPEDLVERIDAVVLLGPAARVDFKFHLSNWLGGEPKDALEVLPEIEKLPRAKLTCVCGEDETESPCRKLAPPVRSVALPGAHHFDGDFDRVAETVLAAALPSPPSC